MTSHRRWYDVILMSFACWAQRTRKYKLHEIHFNTISFMLRDFSVKSNSICSLFQTVSIRFSNIHCLRLICLSLPKGWRRCILVWKCVKRLKFPVKTADVTYCSDVTHFLHVTSGRLSRTLSFLALYCFNIYLASYSSYKLCFYLIVCSRSYASMPKLNRTKLMRNG